ncbi:MAG: hypothetical protein JST76_15350 [Bacteroidetes bacterium]|nr:hypothetical protein [Bacteroidota bacterium]
MSQRFATIISYLFHPLLFATYGAAFIVAVNPHLFAEYHLKAQILWIIITFIFTFMTPVILIGMMKRLELITDYQMTNPQERIIPYILTATLYLWTYRLFRPTTQATAFTNQLISLMMLGASVAIFIGFFINIFRKISIHAIGMGCMLGLVLVMMQVSDYDLKLVFVGVIILGGVVGTARLVLDAHQQAEVYAGYLVGFIGMFFSFTLIPMLFTS